MNEKSENEVKKNGNIILYEEKTKNIIWQTNTENKGNGPYDFYLTNDRRLILQDVNGNTLYEYSNSRNVPTIYYSNKKDGEYVTNNFILDGLDLYGCNRLKNEKQQTCENPSYIHIKTEDNNKFQLSYAVRIIETDEWFYHNNHGKYYPKRYLSSWNFDMFYAFLDTDNDIYDICYTARSNFGHWTLISCNGDEINIKDIHDVYIEAIIIYIKEKGENMPRLDKY